MDYKSLMGYGKKKKVVKEQPKPKKRSVLDGVKQELSEWIFKPPTEKRWTKSFGGRGITEYEERKEKEVNEGPAGDYEPYLRAIDQNYKRYWDSVKDFEKLLVKKGLKKEAHNLHSFYTKFVVRFHQFFEKFVRKLM